MPDTTILVVDDVEPVRRMMLRLLRHAGFPNVLQACSAEEALELLEGRSLDLLITDLRLPGIDGAELVQRVRATLPDLPVLVVSALRGVDLEQSMTGLEGLELLSKPFAPVDLERKVRQALSQTLRK